jgi:predicted dehydrogenase
MHAPSSSIPSRRKFLKTAAETILGAPFIQPSGSYSKPLNSMLQVASVGADGMPYGDIKNFATHPKVKLVAFCDIDSNRFEKVDKDFPDTPHFADYMEMYSKLGDSLDAVGVGTPDHSHARASIEAMKRGKHVYCQKPLAHTVWECRQMRLWAEKTGVITQMGNQIHSAIEYRLGVRLIQDGAIGKVKEVHSWISVDGRERTAYDDRPSGTLECAPPPNVNWDLWIGGAPMRGYVPDAYHPFVWRDWQDFGTGALGDFGCHVFDPVFTALELTAPISIRAEHAGTNKEVWPGPEKVYYTFPGTKWTVGQLPVTWYDGKLQPPRELAKIPDTLKMPGGGSLFIGEKGNMVLQHVAGPRLYPQENFTGFAYPKDVVGLNHRHVWIDAIFEGKKTSDGFHYAGPLAETVQLGNIAARMPGVTLEWDAANMKFAGNDAAQKLLSREYRKGFEVTPVASQI